MLYQEKNSNISHKIITSSVLSVLCYVFCECVVVLCIAQYDKVCMFYSGVVRELSHKTTAVTQSKDICNHLSETHNIEMFSVHVEDIGFDMV